MDNDDYYGLGYQDKVDEMNRLEGEINNKILEIKNIGKNGSTISIEKEVSDLLQKYSENLSKFRMAYIPSKIPTEMPPSTVNKRKLVIEGLDLNYNRVRKNFDETVKNKYKTEFVDKEISEETKNKFKTLSNQQLFEEQKKLLKDQNEIIGDITKNVISGEKQAKSIKHEVKNQNEKLNHLKDDVIFIF